MHELQGRRCCFRSLSFINVDLRGHLGARSQHTSMATYHRGIELIYRLPLLLSRIHHIDFRVLQRSFRVHILHNGLCRITQPTRASSEEGYAAVKKTGRSSKHDRGSTHESNGWRCCCCVVEMIRFPDLRWVRKRKSAYR
jgi:hypothetical protein